MVKLKRTRVEFEGRVTERETVVEEEHLEPWEQDHPLRVVGRPAPRVDGAARVTGQAVYTRDVQLPGMAIGRILRCPHPHARVRHVDSTAAEALPGVRLVWHCEQPPPVNDFKKRALFPEELAYQGAEVALVVADDERAAGEGLAALEVAYEELPFATDMEAALAEGAPRVRLDTESNLVRPGGKVYERGDVERGWQQAEVAVDLTFTTAGAAHSPMETHGCVARWEGDELTVWISTQGVFSVREQLAEVLDLPRDKVRVICDFMGGGFGAKQEADRHTMLAAQAARELGRPVRLVLDRSEEYLVGGYRPAGRHHIRLGARRDGTLTCIEHEAWQHVGAYGGEGYGVTGPSEQLYACPNVRTVHWAVRANTDSGRAFRAPGYVEATVALEGAVDQLAHELGMDPLDLRLKNYTATNPKRREAYTTKGLRASYEMGAERSGWRERHGEARERGPYRRGWGMASQMWGGGGGPPANAIVKLLADGTAEVLVGVQDIGTGTRTVLAQIAAEELGVELEAVRVVLGDTLPTPYGPTSSGSQTLPSAGPAVRAAARDCLRRLFGLAAQMMERPDAGEDELAVQEGQIVYLPEPDRRIPFEDVAHKMDGYTFVGEGSRGPNPDEKAINTFGAQFAEVDVNVHTGQVRVRQVVAVHDVGRVINPLTATNQVYGGITQGMGYGIMEGLVFDDGQSGVQLTNSLETYRVPTIVDAPGMDVSFVDRADVEANSIGALGLGEPPIIPTPAAILNAVADAIGVRITDLPITPPRVLRALESHREEEGTA